MGKISARTEFRTSIVACSVEGSLDLRGFDSLLVAGLTFLRQRSRARSLLSIRLILSRADSRYGIPNPFLRAYVATREEID